ncbi:type 2 isopentenyl-diphosphate Delta-isomerase [Limosilactobacillus sp.]|jgi:isopentenyl-diphosphate delta-isomerase|uniref:type 2 isopentenyl-diphosphate Delta-isomerase n=1 Tax=Limosilactobacillus sp. TaxID=2773925 RepID=UPI0025BBB720|nr:type 2 isopentenyl-diphosphate Delta-isomerase [Limosilactobacillus sp.]MCH3922947.1 type 2 isopentenyl-diphosphate Delta-isomerase [Limosilactobacillus sp.]MCH3927630.1 type 2 isopentenyl-diphosphate Delta-isomerase [Limosilactobacillus sp.]
MESQQAHRKDEHLSLALATYQQTHDQDYFNQVRLIHDALPETALAEVDPRVQLGQSLTLDWPFYLEAMTGGSKRAATINASLARQAAKHHLAMATGSLSVALREPATRDSFTVVRELNPDGKVFANLSAGASLEAARKAIDLLQADALELHLNAAQELIMPEGDRAFHWLDNIGHLVEELPVPVIVKEVGFGMSKRTISRLIKAGVSYINVSGRGGTNFAAIENRRNHQLDLADLEDWGQTTPEALLEARAVQPTVNLIASGGIVSPLDLVKAGVLGAQAAGVAGYFLRVLVRQGEDALDEELSRWQEELKRLLTLLGCQRFTDLPRQIDFVLTGDLYTYAQQRALL